MKKPSERDVQQVMSQLVQSSFDLLYLNTAGLGYAMHIIPHLFGIDSGKPPECCRMATQTGQTCFSIFDENFSFYCDYFSF